MTGYYALSAYAANGMTAMEIVEQVPYLPHPQVRESTVGQLRDLGLGLSVVYTWQWPHVSIRFPSFPTDSELDEVIAVFSAPYPNPAVALS